MYYCLFFLEKSANKTVFTMKISGQVFTIKQLFFLILYYSILFYMPCSTNLVFGKLMKQWRYLCCRNIFLKCGRNVNIERKAIFGSGRNLIIGDNSGIGINCCIPGNTIIGKNVMMGPNVYILGQNHEFTRVDIPMIMQGHTKVKQTIIEDDVWIGRDVLMTPGRTIQKGTIIAGGTVLCKDFPE